MNQITKQGTVDSDIESDVTSSFAEKGLYPGNYKQFRINGDENYNQAINIIERKSIQNSYRNTYDNQYFMNESILTVKKQGMEAIIMKEDLAKQNYQAVNLEYFINFDEEDNKFENLQSRQQINSFVLQNTEDEDPKIQ